MLWGSSTRAKVTVSCPQDTHADTKLGAAEKGPVEGHALKEGPEAHCVLSLILSVELPKAEHMLWLRQLCPGVDLSHTVAGLTACQRVRPLIGLTGRRLWTAGEPEVELLTDFNIDSAGMGVPRAMPTVRRDCLPVHAVA